MNDQIILGGNDPFAREEEQRRLIPEYESFHRMPLSLVNLERTAPIVVDLGCGPGTMTARVLKRWPKAHCLLIDYNPDMIDAARTRFEDHGDFSYVVDDFMLANLGWMRCDLVVSSLALHRQDPAEKRALFARVFDTLRPGGYFVLCDLVCGSTPASERALAEAWRAYATERLEGRADADALLRPTPFDKPDTVEDQITWLRKTGFTDVECAYRMLRFASIVARKPLRRA